MAKEKRSFLSRLTGTDIEEQDDDMQSMPIYTEETEENYMEMDTPEKEEAPVHTPVSHSTEEDAEGQLTIDMYQNDEAIVIKSTIAGVKPEKLDVSINNDMITLRGERSSEDEVEGEDYYYRECYWGSFSRSVVLPVDIIPEKAEASLKNGILTIKLPKAETNKVKKIQVRGF